MNQPVYPALYDAVGKKPPSLLGAASFVVGRSETAALPVLEVPCSRPQFPIIRAEGRRYAEPPSRTRPTYLNGQPIGRRTPLTQEDHLEAGERPSVPPGRKAIPIL